MIGFEESGFNGNWLFCFPQKERFQFGVNRLTPMISAHKLKSDACQQRHSIRLRNSPQCFIKTYK
jgi:hypothetical protein